MGTRHVGGYPLGVGVRRAVKSHSLRVFLSLVVQAPGGMLGTGTCHKKGYLRTSGEAKHQRFNRDGKRKGGPISISRGDAGPVREGRESH